MSLPTPLDRLCADAGIRVILSTPGAPDGLVRLTREIVHFGRVAVRTITVQTAGGHLFTRVPTTPAQVLAVCWVEAKRNPGDPRYGLDDRLRAFLGSDWPVVEGLLMVPRAAWAPPVDPPSADPSLDRPAPAPDPATGPVARPPGLPGGAP